jgi:hypothetical protein
MNWHNRKKPKLAWSWDPTNNETSPPFPSNVPPAAPGAAALPSRQVAPIVPKRQKIRPGGKKRRIRQPGQALGPALPQDAARPNAASSDPRDLRGL